MLESPGKVSMEVARALALEKDEKFSGRRLVEDTDREAMEDDREFEKMAKKLEENYNEK